ncbi:MAG: nuclear transport factor 2 family protein [Erysipelotrichaceae bacterium]|nr:nuclear transport factor 2 family protein [Erysipelotrichaceae bacterium]
MDQTYMMNTMEICQLVDELAFQLDCKNLDKAMELFSEDAELKLIENGKEVLDAKGKDQIRENLSARMADFDYLFHSNGTKVYDLKSLDQAAQVNTSCICRYQTLSSKNTVTQYIEYLDQMIKVNGFWYIVSRTVKVISQSVQ